jgi:hypothetical protein
MLERRLVLERRQDYRGPATRFVAPISDAVEADTVIRECCFAMLVLGAFQIFLTFTMGGGSVTIGIVLIAAATLLVARRGVLSAVVLLTVCVVLLSIQAWATVLGYPAIYRDIREFRARVLVHAQGGRQPESAVDRGQVLSPSTRAIRLFRAVSSRRTGSR